MERFKKILLPAGWIVSVVLTIGSRILDGVDASQLGLPFWAWEAIGLASFFAMVLAVLYKRQSPKPTHEAETKVQGRDTFIGESEDRSSLAGDVRMIIMPGIEDVTPSVRFTTEGKRGQHFNLRGRPRAIRFVTLGGRIVKEVDLPVEIPCGSGKLVIKQFTDSGFSWDEVGTIGDRVQVEFYLLETSS